MFYIIHIDLLKCVFLSGPIGTSLAFQSSHLNNTFYYLPASHFPLKLFFRTLVSFPLFVYFSLVFVFVRFPFPLPFFRLSFVFSTLSIVFRILVDHYFRPTIFLVLGLQQYDLMMVPKMLRLGSSSQT